MMKQITGRVTRILTNAALQGAGDGYLAPQGRKAFQIEMTGTATVAIEASLDGEHWHSLTSVSASGLYENNAPYPLLRANVTAYTDGLVNVHVAREL